MSPIGDTNSFNPDAQMQLTEDMVDPYLVPDTTRNACALCGESFKLIVRGRVSGGVSSVPILAVIDIYTTTSTFRLTKV